MTDFRMTSPTSARHYFVEGRVQGVGFRAFVRETARDLSLAGWVRNREDGRVEIFAEGPEPALQDFQNRVSEGPRLSRVLRVTVEKADQKDLQGFVITG